MDLVHTALNAPGSGSTEDYKDNGKHRPDDLAIGHIHGEADAAENADAAAKNTENLHISGPFGVHFLHAGDGLSHIPAEFGVFGTGSIYKVCLTKQTPEGPDFKIRPLVAHFHTLFQNYPAFAVYHDPEISELGPGKDHHG